MIVNIMRDDAVDCAGDRDLIRTGGVAAVVAQLGRKECRLADAELPAHLLNRRAAFAAGRMQSAVR